MWSCQSPLPARGRLSSQAVLILTAAATVAACAKNGGGSGAAGMAADAGGASMSIGRAGGEIRNPDGSGLVAPVDALPLVTTLEVAPYEGDVSQLPQLPEGFALAGAPYAFTPHGQSFDNPITIRLPYESSRLGKVVLWLESPEDPKWGMLEEGPSYSMGIASVQVRSFSIYAVAHPDNGESIVCAEGLRACDGECVDTATRNEHCGACRNRCDTHCEGGICAPPPPMECAEDGECDDGVYCNGGETCADNLCQSGSAPDCDDGDPLTDDSCLEESQQCENVVADMDAGT